VQYTEVTQFFCSAASRRAQFAQQVRFTVGTICATGAHFEKQIFLNAVGGEL